MKVLIKGKMTPLSLFLPLKTTNSFISRVFLMNESYVIIRIFFAILYASFIINEQNGDACLTSNTRVVIDINVIK